MKPLEKILRHFTFLFVLIPALAAGQAKEDAVVLVPLDKIAEKPAPLFFSADATSVVNVFPSSTQHQITVKFRVHQGRPETLSLGLAGVGEIDSVTGDGLATWTLRKEADGSRFLDFKPVIPAVNAPDPLPKEFTFVVNARHEVPAEQSGQAFDLLHPAPGAAVGFSSTVELKNEGDAIARVVEVTGLQPLQGMTDRFFTGNGKLRVALGLKSNAARPVELVNIALNGKPADDLSGISFLLRGELNVTRPGEAMELLEGAALSGAASGEGWFTRLKKQGDGFVHEIVGERAGTFPFELSFEAPLVRSGDWRGVDFKLQGGAVVPVSIEGLEEGVSFKQDDPVVPEHRDGKWTGFLPAAGNASFAWKSGRVEGEGALFFSSSEIAETRVGAGIARRYSRIGYRVLQGKLESLEIRVDGIGEILAMKGPQVLNWSLVEEAGSRMLEVRLSRPIEGQGDIEIEAQSAIGSFPAKLDPLRFAPIGTLRHSGYLRVANEGAVRLEIVAASGLMQLSPAQFPWAKENDGFRQAFVYRFPSAEYSYGIAADQVMPEVSLTETTIHELVETDRRIVSDLELDIREAPLREWTVEVPEDFAVAAVQGEPVADYSLATEAKEGRRSLKILFNGPLIGRHLVTLRLEKNLSPQPGEWVLPVLVYPGVKSSRGFIGVVSAAGYRVVPGNTTGLAEIPPDYFPKKQPGLQQAFRIREMKWSATMKIEALGQSIQADVFHLYSLKEGEVSVSVLVNYFVVGAPASQWRIRVPAGLGDVQVTGQNIGVDWRQEGDLLVIPLARPVIGTGTVLVTFNQPMSARGGELSPGEVRPLDVQSERGYVQVVSPLQVKFEDTRSEGSLLKIEASELPAEYRLLSSAPTLGAWQYTAADISLGTKVEWYVPGETIEQLVDRADLSSRVSRDGQVVTDARLFVKARGRSVLGITLPEHASLWEAKVGGAIVNAREDGKKILVPLDGQADPNDPIEVLLRYGVPAASATSPVLATPQLDAPTVFTGWKVSADENRRLVPKMGQLKPVAPVLTETGAEWIDAKARVITAWILMVAAVGLVLSRIAKVRALGALFTAGAGVWALLLAGRAFTERRVNLGSLEFAMPVVPPSEAITVQIGNVAPWLAMLSVGGILLALLGIGAIVHGFIQAKWSSWTLPVGVALLALGLLLQRMGAVAFFACFGSALLLGKALPVLLSLMRRPAVAATALVLFSFFTSLTHGEEVAPADAFSPLESAVHTWRIADGRLTGEVILEARGKADERHLLLKAPAVLTSFEGDGWRVVKAPVEGQEAYLLVGVVDGKKRGKATFEMPLPNPQAGWQLPSGAAAVQRVSVRWNQAGWEFGSPQAAKVTQVAGQGESGADLILKPASDISLVTRPMQRDAAAEQTQFYAEISDLYIPGAGMVSGRHFVAIRPSRGVVRELTLVVPEGFTVGEVVDGPVGAWRFNPESRELKVAIEPAQQQPFTFIIGTQRGTAALPVDLTLAPLQVNGAAGSFGLLGLGFGDDSQAEAVEAKGMSAVNLDDFEQGLLPKDREGRSLAVLHRAFRHGGAEASVTLKVAPVAPEIRAETKQTLSLGEDRMVLAIDLTASITRSGVFKLSLEVPAEFEIESVTGAALAQWTETKEDSSRLLNLHLNGRTIGQQVFAITLAAPSPGAQPSWAAPRVSLRNAGRQTGTLTVVPDRGLQVRAITRDKVSQLDPREAGVPRPGALAFRLLQSDWALSLNIAKLDPWVTAQILHEVTLREGQTLGRVRLAYRIENAAMKSLRVRIPGLDPGAAATVRASGPAVADIVPVIGEEGLWEIRFQRGIAGATIVDIEFQQQSAAGRVEIAPLVPAEVRQSSYFVAVRTAGRLEMTPAPEPRGWQQIDWGTVPEILRDSFSGQAPAKIYRVAEAEAPLAIDLKRHGLAGTLRLRVESANLTSLVAPGGAALTAVDLAMQVGEKGPLKLTLPKDAVLYSVFVNEDGVPVVQNGDQSMFYVYPAPEGNRPTPVRFIYSTPKGSSSELEGPMLDVPLENLTWRVILPEGWRLRDHSGDFDLQRQLSGAEAEDYAGFISRKRAAGKQDAVALLDQANVWLQSGEQEKAGQAFGKAIRNGFLDQASNEDARVQLHKLKTQQATLALNTRRQRLYLDNRSEVALGNVQLEKAADQNPLLQGHLNYDPREFERLLEGNTVDENTAMKAIADRIVNQQLAADPAPSALDVTLEERGTILDFRRSVQVDGNKPMHLKLDVAPVQRGGWLYGIIVSVLGAAVVSRRK
ncbi:hypothetical protein [Luteolibacter luteus]|uniref:Uncharacterized protein n=1 Tax=Luteolibacter luteus TaxID=2728835 RepID=A0A858RNH6_9BACT|nr:hypothetical protein [Luteolibacter luteus]QJE98054.1 hypothetical protein HHL09_20450 [Luteolibacter luteus]